MISAVYWGDVMYRVELQPALPLDGVEDGREARREADEVKRAEPLPRLREQW